jgi:hypothetical protein
MRLKIRQDKGVFSRWLNVYQWRVSCMTSYLKIEASIFFVNQNDEIRDNKKDKLKYVN